MTYLRRELTIIFILSTIAFITGIYENINRPDAGLYHLPFISNINENKIIIGLNNLHSRFGLTSFLQYLSAVFNNSLFKDKAIFFPNLILFAASLIYFLKLSINKNSSNEIKILSIFFAISIAVDMNRFSEFGNDENAHMLYFILISHILILYLRNNYNRSNTINIILLISLYLFMIKIIYSLVILLILPIILMSFKDFNKTYKYKFFLFSIFILWLFKNLLISSCFIYPVDFTCVEAVSWNYNSNLDLISEGWAKGYPDSDNNFKINEYVKNFNWLETWSSNHLNFILKKLAILLVIYSFLIIFFNKQGIKFNLSKELKIVLYINLIFCLIWFIKFPVYRLGSGFLISTIILFSIILIRRFDRKNFEILFKSIVGVTIILISYKNLDRIFDKLEQDNSKPWINIYSNKTNKTIEYKRVKFLNSTKEFYYTTIEKELCFYSPSPCTHDVKGDLKIKNIGNYKIILR